MIKYKIISTKKRIKKVTLTISPAGILIVKTPININKKYINRLIEKHYTWIQKQSNKNKKIYKEYKKNIYYIFGNPYKLKTKKYSKKRTYVIVDYDNNIVNLYYNKNITNQNIKKSIKKEYKKIAQSYFMQKISIYSKVMGLKPNKVFIKSQKSLWGSCSAKNNINLNLRLLVYKKEVIDYVIIHELAHIKHKNHKKEFWELVATYCPYYKQAKKELNNKLLKLYAEKI